MHDAQMPTIMLSPSPTQVYAAVYDGDGCWYRCKVLDISDDEVASISPLDEMLDIMLWYSDILYIICMCGSCLVVSHSLY